MQVPLMIDLKTRHVLYVSVNHVIKVCDWCRTGVGRISHRTVPSSACSCAGEPFIEQLMQDASVDMPSKQKLVSLALQRYTKRQTCICQLLHASMHEYYRSS